MYVFGGDAVNSFLNTARVILVNFCLVIETPRGLIPLGGTE